MKTIFYPGHASHNPQSFLVRGQLKPSAEQPERAARLHEAAQAAGHDIIDPEDFGLGPIAAVHTPEYLKFLSTGHAEWAALEGSGPEILANVHPVGGAGRSEGQYPRSIVGRAGYHMADTACPIGPGTWQGAYHSAQTAITAAGCVQAGEPHAYALCRPPGHHAYADMAGGFCFLNNSAIAAQCLREHHDRVAILDVDVHHGNGTQGIFYRRADVLTVSIHADPLDYYPFFWGHAHERGEDAGAGYNMNLPLPVGSDDTAFLHALGDALERIAFFTPGALVVALGLDAHEDDPLQGMRVTTQGFAKIGGEIAAFAKAHALPTVLVQEGGYLNDALGENLVSFLSVF